MGVVDGDEGAAIVAVATRPSARPVSLFRPRKESWTTVCFGTLACTLLSPLFYSLVEGRGLSFTVVATFWRCVRLPP